MLQHKMTADFQKSLIETGVTSDAAGKTILDEVAKLAKSILPGGGSVSVGSTTMGPGIQVDSGIARDGGPVLQ